MSALESYKSFVTVTSAEAVSNTQVGVVLANGEEALINFSYLIGKGPWKRLTNPVFFNRAHAAFDTIVWTDDIDIAPEEVWERAHRSICGHSPQAKTYYAE